MSTIDEPTINHASITSPESKYRSMFKPSKLLWKNNKTTPSAPLVPPLDSGDARKDMMPGQEVPSHTSLRKLPTIRLPSASIHALTSRTTTTKKNDIYELATVNDSGVYLTSISSTTTDGKHDHWLDLNDDDDTFSFFLPSCDCLTTVYGQPHSFYTPSSIIISS